MRTAWRKPWTGVAALLLTPVLCVACGATGGTEPMPDQSPAPGAGSSAPPLSSTDLPTMRPPGKPPKTPTDLVPHDVAAGRVTRGGSGPCYRLTTEDGTEYALHSTAGLTLVEGSYVRIRFAAPATGVDCGPGRPVTLLEATRLDQ